MLPVGVILATISVFEGSLVWSAFCILTGWIGFAAGLGASTGFADKIESEFKRDGNVNVARPKLPSVKDFALFWGPTLAVIAFGQLMIGKLPNEFKPRYIQLV